MELNDNSVEEKGDKQSLIPPSQKLLTEKNDNGIIDVQKKENKDEKESESSLKKNTEEILNNKTDQKGGKIIRVKTITVDNNDPHEIDNTKNNEKNNQTISDELDSSDQSSLKIKKIFIGETNENSKETNKSFKDDSVEIERINLVTQLTDKIETKEESNNTTQSTSEENLNKNQVISDNLLKTDKIEIDRKNNEESEKDENEIKKKISCIRRLKIGIMRMNQN